MKEKRHIGEILRGADEPTAERIAELSGSNNLQRKPLIQLVEEKPAAPKKAAAKKPAKKPADK